MQELDLFHKIFLFILLSHAELDSASLKTTIIIVKTLNQVQGDVFIILDFNKWFYFFFSFLKKKRNKRIQGEIPNPILFSREKASLCHQKNCISHYFAKTNRTITNVCIW
jgi:hypothetical protein